MSFVDPTPQRVSTCPVHFIWDGKGRGRSLVRAGFLGVLLASALTLLALVLHIDVLRQAGALTAAASAASWLSGHALGLPLFNQRDGSGPLKRARAAPPR